MKEQLIIFDTTMRDGEQSPGASMTKEEKLRIARQLERMRVDVIEAGFAASEPRRFRRGARRGGHRQGQHGVLARPRQRPRHQARGGGDRAGEAAAHSHLHRHLARSTWRRSCG